MVGQKSGTSLEEFMVNMTMAENMIKVRKNGVAYADETKLDVAIALANQVGVDFVEWWNTYHDYQRFG